MNLNNLHVESKQEWKGEFLDFDPDSSPKAWEFYNLMYPNDQFKNYDKGNITFFNRYSQFNRKEAWKIRGDDYYYSSKPLHSHKNDIKYNRLFVIDSNQSSVKEDNIFYYNFCYRLSGETDFNFKSSKLTKFNSLLKFSFANFANKESHAKKLEYCNSMQHSIFNFSLMQSVGNLQKIKWKGICVDNKFE